MRYLSIALVAMVLVAPAAPALAQGTSGTLPDPVSSRDLSRYADRLGLSDDQRLAIEAFHDDYRDGFRRLRETDIEAFLESTQSINFGWRLLESREVILDSINDAKKIMARIRNLDEQLFSQVQTILTDEQTIQMTRVRQMRARDRYGSGLVQFTRFVNPSSRIDVTDLLFDTGVDAATLQAVEPIVVPYEASLTASMKKLSDATLTLADDLFEKLDELGLTEEAMRDPRRRGAMFAQFGVMWSEVTMEITERTVKISELNRRTVDDLQAALPDAPAREIYDAFYVEGYPEAGAGQNPARRHFEKALELSELTAGQREQIVALRRGFDDTADRLTEEAADLLDKAREQPMRFIVDLTGARARLEKSLETLGEQRGRANTTAIESLEGVLGPDLATRVGRHIADADDNGARVFTGSGVATGPRPEADRARPDRSPDTVGGSPADPFIPRAISSTDVAGYAGRLGFASDLQPILESFHDDYLESFKRVEANEIESVRAAEEKLWTMDDAGVMHPPEAAQIAHVFRLRRQAVAATDVVDRAFFQDVATLVGDDAAAAVERLRLSRQRDVYRQGIRAGGSGPSFRGGPGGQAFMPRTDSQESSLDVSAVVSGVDPPIDGSGAVARVLLAYEQDATRIFELGWKATLDYREAMDRITAESGGRRRPRGMRDVMENEATAVREARDRITQLNRTTLAQLEEAVPPPAVADLRHAYYRQAYPGVYDDPHTLTPSLMSALSLDDLSSQQRSSLTDMSTQYRSTYDTLSWQMVEVKLRELSEDANARGNRASWAARAQRERDLDRLRAERDDLNHKTLLRLRALLGDDQSGRIGLDGELERALDRDAG